MVKLGYLFGVFVLLFSSVGLAWFDTDFEFRQNIIVNISENVSEYQVLLNVTFDSEMQTDFSDLMFVNGTDGVELNYWIREKVDSSHADVWVKFNELDTDNGTQGFIYFGNASAVTPRNNGSNVFQWFDEFERANGPIGSGWINGSSAGGSGNIDGGRFRIQDSSGAGSAIFSLVNSTTDAINIYEWKIEFLQTNAAADIELIDNDNNGRNVDLRPNAAADLRYVNAGGEVDSGDNYAANTNNTWRIISYQANHTFDWFVDNVNVVDGDTWRDSSPDVIDRFRFTSAGADTGIWFFEYMFRRQHIFDEPESEFGATAQFTNNVTVDPSRATGNQSVTITWNASDSDGIDTVFFNITKPDAGIENINFSAANVSSVVIAAVFNNTSLLGQYNVTAFLNDSSGNIASANEVTFDVNETGFNTSFTQSPFETSSQTFTLSVLGSVNIEDVNATLFFNSTPILTNKTNVSTNYTFVAGTTIPIIFTNETTVGHFWEINSSNGTVVSENSTNGTQTVLLAYFADNITLNQSTALSGETFIATFSTTDLVGTTLDSDFIEFNGTNETANPVLLVAPHLGLTQNNLTFNITGFYVITLNSVVKTLTANTTLNVTSFGVTNCSNTSFSTNTSLTFFHRDEDNDSLLGTSDTESWFNVSLGTSSQSFGFTFTNQNNFTICIFPDNQELSVDSTILYSSDNHEERTYFLDDAAISVTNQNVTLYHTLTSLSTNVTILVQEDTGVALENHLVNAQRFFPGEGAGVFKTVEIGKTNAQGRAFMSLQRGEIYRWQVTLAGRVLQIYGPYPWGPEATTLTIKVITGTSGEWYAYKDSVGHSCDVVQTPGSITCSITDTSGLQVEACLDVFIVNGSGMFNNSSQCSTSAAATFIYLVPNESLKYYFILQGEYGLTDNIWDSGYYDFPGIPDFGDIGIVIAIVMIVMFSLGAGSVGKEFMIIGALFGLIIATGTGVLAAGYGEVIGVIVLGVVAIYVLTQGRT
jgi:hypothetical protein